MSTPTVTIKMERIEDQVKTSVINEAQNDTALHLMVAAIKLFLADKEALETYAQVARTYIESETYKKENASE